MLHSRVLVSAALIGVILVVPRVSNAEPVRIPVFTASLSAYPNWPTGPILFDVNGPTLSFRGESAREVQPGQRLSPCYPRRCAAGSSVDFLGLKRFGSAYGDGVLTLNGERFHVSAIVGEFAVAGPVARIPPIVNGLAEVTVPISIIASLVASVSRDFQTERRVDLRLIGNGTAHMKLLRPPAPGDELYPEDWLDDVTLDFASGADPAPVPEPGTLLLLGTGAVVIRCRAWRCRTAAQRNDSDATDE